MFLTRPLFAPRNARQQEAMDAWRRCQCLILHGPAGTGKTFLAVALAVQHLCRPDRGHQHLYLCRPAQPAGEQLGFLPGSDREKIAPYLYPLHDAMRQLGVDPEAAWRKKFLEEVPVAHLQGRNFDGVALLDEAQNCSAEMLRMFLTRQNSESKLILSGDPAQRFGPHRDVFDRAAARLEEIHGVEVVRFGRGDIVRHPLVGQYLDALDGL